MAEYREAKAPEGKRGSYKKLAEMRIEPIKGENGGVLVSHHHEFGGPSTGHAQRMASVSTPPAVERHMFEKENGSELMNHMKKHLGKYMNFPAEASGEEHEGPSSQEEAASEPAEETIAGQHLSDRGGRA